MFENAVRDTSTSKLRPITGTKHKTIVNAINRPPLRLAMNLSIFPKLAFGEFSTKKRNAVETTKPINTHPQDNLKRTFSTVMYCSQKSKGIPLGQIISI